MVHLQSLPLRCFLSPPFPGLHHLYTCRSQEFVSSLPGWLAKGMKHLLPFLSLTISPPRLLLHQSFRCQSTTESQSAHFASFEAWMTTLALPSPHYHTGPTPASCLLSYSTLNLPPTSPSMLSKCVPDTVVAHSCPYPFSPLKRHRDPNSATAAWILEWHDTAYR